MPALVPADNRWQRVELMFSTIRRIEDSRHCPSGSPNSDRSKCHRRDGRTSARKINWHEKSTKLPEQKRRCCRRLVPAIEKRPGRENDIGSSRQQETRGTRQRVIGESRDAMHAAHGQRSRGRGALCQNRLSGRKDEQRMNVAESVLSESL